ncbi:NIPSNAP family protein [Kitasatospora sp. McL0602]|uniref:NIPSNAP family protein n=1 Tax=Kitasatospora sp. McL0602 TaxID=3439530 RepID=UPI003F8CB871
MSIVELRQYTLHPGARDTLIELFEGEFVAGQEAVGIGLGGRFRDLDDPDRFVWLRSFPDLASRAPMLGAFYSGPVWQAHREAANATMADSDDVLLLRGPGFAAQAGEVVTLTICHLADSVAAAHVERTLADGALGVHRTEHAENTFPALPVREDAEVVLWFTPGDHRPEHAGRPVERVEVLRLEHV